MRSQIGGMVDKERSSVEQLMDIVISEGSSNKEPK
jgi:hypothetical protein